MNSQEFISQYPTISQKTASYILREHGLEMSDYLDSAPVIVDTNKIDTADLLGWMGY